MKATKIFTENKSYWHFHAIGVGVILTYHLNSMQVIMTCEYTGQMIQYKDFYNVGGLNREEFRDICTESYKDAIEKGQTINLDYLEDPTILINCIGVDFDLIKN